ncbi:MAG: hypothetical protein PHQ13_15720 [Rhodoferax sp.]|nr:hypothetical protein [Rhodoferax sp.]
MRHPQKLDDHGRVDLLQFAHRHSFKIGESGDPFASNKAFVSLHWQLWIMPDR